MGYITGGFLFICVLAFLPALLCAFSGKIVSTILVAFLCLFSIILLPIGGIFGAIVWFFALIIAMMSSWSAKRDKQHRAMLRELKHLKGRQK